MTAADRAFTPLVASALGELLQRHGWYDGTRARSQRELARRVGVVQETARKMFRPIDPGNDERDFNEKTLRALAAATDIPLADILDAAHADQRVALLGDAPRVPMEERAVLAAAVALPAGARRRLVARLTALDVSDVS